MKFKKMKRRVFPILLAAAMTVTSFPAVPVTAAENEEVTVENEFSPVDFNDSEQSVLEPEAEGKDVDEAVSENGNVNEGAEPEEVGSEEDTAEKSESEETDLEENAVKEPAAEKSEAEETTVEAITEEETTAVAVEESQELSDTFSADVKVVGSNGVQYDDVAYLSMRAYNSLPDDAKDVYKDMCESVIEWKENGDDVHNIVISLDENGALGMDISIPVKNLFTADTQSEVSIDKEETVEADEQEDTSETEKDSEIKDGSDVNETDTENKVGIENDANTGNKESIGTDTNAEDKESIGTDADAEDKEGTDSDANTGDKEGTVTDSDEEDKQSNDTDVEVGNKNDADSDSETEGGAISASGNNADSDDKGAESDDVSDTEGFGETEVSDKFEEVVEENGFVSENVELAESYTAAADAREISLNELDTLHSNQNYFKKQLSSKEQVFYEAGEKIWVDEKAADTSTDEYVGYIFPSKMLIYGTAWENALVNSISALVDSYPNSFNWMDLGCYPQPLQAHMEYKNGNGTYETYLAKSPYYQSGLETQADQKVQSLVDAAVSYAVANYPANPTYGIIEYFDNWICENNEYNWDGTDSNKMDTDTYFYCHSAYGILLKGYGVCESYALAMTRLLDRAGIKNLYVVGDADTGDGVGGHAWNYVQMPDNKWYLLDSTWNDSENKSNKMWLLKSDDGMHMATGKRFNEGKKFKFEKLSTTDYPIPEGSAIILKPKQKYSMSVKDSYYSKMVTEWSSSDSNIVAVDKDGQLTAGKNPGNVTIKAKLRNGSSCNISVRVSNYKVSKLVFSNGKTSYTETKDYTKAELDNNYKYLTEDEKINYNSFDITISVNQGDPDINAEELQKYAGVSPTITLPKTSVVAVSDPIVEGNTIKFSLLPYSIGKSKITVKFGGKSASYTINVKYSLQEDWFSCDIQDGGYSYTGKAIKPKVSKTSAGNAVKVKYKVTYVNNKNAGTATVKITGTGNFAGTVEKTFNINKIAAPEGELQFISCTPSAKYNGAGQQPKTKVKVGKKTLKAGSDYVLLYKKVKTADGQEVTESDYKEDLPKEAGTYLVTIKGNNYNLDTANVNKDPKTFEITKTTFDKVKIVCPSSVKATGSDLLAELKASNKIAAKIGKNILKEYKEQDNNEYADYTLSVKNSNGEDVDEIVKKDTYTLTFTYVENGKNIDPSTKPAKNTITKRLKVK